MSAGEAIDFVEDFVEPFVVLGAVAGVGLEGFQAGLKTTDGLWSPAPRPFKPRAIPHMDVTPSARISSMVGSTSAARSLAILANALAAFSRPVARASSVKLLGRVQGRPSRSWRALDAARASFMIPTAARDAPPRCRRRRVRLARFAHTRLIIAAECDTIPEFPVDQIDELLS